MLDVFGRDRLVDDLHASDFALLRAEVSVQGDTPSPGPYSFPRRMDPERFGSGANRAMNPRRLLVLF